jgi:hypothetical protein
MVQMMRVLVVSVVVVLAGALPARADSFDIVGFTTPTGWKRESSASGVQLSRQDGGNYVVAALTKSIASAGDGKANFDAAWQSLVKALVNTGAPQMQPSAQDHGWILTSGGGAFEDKRGKGMIVLVNATGGGKTINLVIVTNAAQYQHDIEAFIASIKLPQVSAASATPTAPTATTSATAPQRTGDATKLIGRWQASGSSSDPANFGYIRTRYEFHADGTYLFTGRTFQSTMADILIIKETGSYAVAGDSITITPTKSTISAYKKNGGDVLGALGKVQDRKLETVRYTSKFHYFAGIQQWNLVLQADHETERDGRFSGNTTYRNAYYFDQRYTDKDLTAVRN